MLPPAVPGVTQALMSHPQDGTPPGQLRVEAALSLKAEAQAPAAPPAGSVSVQLMRGHDGGEMLGAAEHVTEEAVVAASVDGPGTYGLWCAHLLNLIPESVPESTVRTHIQPLHEETGASNCSLTASQSYFGVQAIL